MSVQARPLTRAHVPRQGGLEELKGDLAIGSDDSWKHSWRVVLAGVLGESLNRSLESADNRVRKACLWQE
jgi:hypothetical protein